MVRVSVDAIETVLYSHSLTVRYSDVNTGKHLGNDKLISLLQEARLAFFRSLNYNELNRPEVGFVVADLAISYKTEAFYDEALSIDVGLGDMAQKSMDVLYKVSKAGSEEVVASAKTGLVFINKQAKKVVNIPEELMREIDRTERHHR